jgi:hypothetical protein
MKNILLKTTLLLFLIWGCKSDTTISQYHSFPDEVWKRFDNPVLELNIEHPGIFYDMWVELDYDEYATHENLAVSVIMDSPSGEIRSRDLLFEFKHEDKNNKPGKCRLILRKDYAFAEKGVCIFEIENRSQRIESRGLSKIGIVLERAQ